MEIDLKWKEEFLEFMKPYEHNDDASLVYYAGLQRKELAVVIMEWLQKNPIDYNSVWEKTEEYDKMIELDDYVTKLSRPYNIFEEVNEEDTLL